MFSCKEAPGDLRHQGRASDLPGTLYPMQDEAPDNPARPHSLAKERIPCSFSDCSWDFLHDAKRRIQGRAKCLFSCTGHSFMDKSGSGCGRHIAGRGHFSYFFLQTGPQAVLQGTTPVPATACSPHGELERDQQHARRRQREHKSPCPFVR